MDNIKRNWYPYSKKCEQLIIEEKYSLVYFIRGRITQPFWNNLSGNTNTRLRFILLKLKSLCVIIDSFMRSIDSSIFNSSEETLEHKFLLNLP